MTPLLSIKNLSVDFVSEKNISNAVKNISFTVNRGEIVAIVGESGSGKTVTSLSVLQLLPSPPARYSSGEILFSEDGSHYTDLLKQSFLDLKNIRGNKIGMIFQEPMSSLNPVFTCGYQVTEAIQVHKKILKEKAKQQTIEWFGKVKLPNPEKIYDRYPHELSGGQKQRVMIAIAMCCNPSLLICDEPTTALDVTVQKKILQLIKELQREQNIGVIFITHDLGIVAEIADRTLVMYQGEIVEQNSVEEIFKNPKQPYTKALIACRPVNHPKGERLPTVSDFLEGKRNKIEKNSPEQSTKEKLADTHHSVLLSVQNLTVSFPAKKNFFGIPAALFHAVNDVSFSVYKGETLGLVGESGCGKTTLGRSLLRLIEPAAGKIIYNHIDFTAKKRDELRPLRKEIQIVFQDPYSSLNPRLTIGDAIAEPLKVHHIGKTNSDRREKVMELLRKVDLKPQHFGRYPHEFSGGQRQRIVIARALSLSPEFLVCDESVSALDASVQAQILNMLNDLKKEYGFTIVFISHDLSVVHYMCNRIMVMNRGKIVESGAADDIYFSPQNEYTKKLLASIPQGRII